jgi:hypothetical protein
VTGRTKVQPDSTHKQRDDYQPKGEQNPVVASAHKGIKHHDRSARYRNIGILRSFYPAATDRKDVSRLVPIARASLEVLSPLETGFSSFENPHEKSEPENRVRKSAPWRSPRFPYPDRRGQKIVVEIAVVKLPPNYVLVKPEAGSSLGQDGSERSLAHLKWVAAQIVTVQLDEVEGIEEDARVVPPVTGAIKAVNIRSRRRRARAASAARQAQAPWRS